MKIGLVARADNSGLGIQTNEFYKHMNPYKTMVVDISRLNGNRQYYGRYHDNHNNMFIKGTPTPNEIEAFLQELDVVFIAEAAYNPILYELAREKGVKTAVQYNYEFMDWLINPIYPKPDMLIAPSKWHYEDVHQWCEANDVKHIYLHCPVNREVLPFRQIKQARKFLHNAGRSAAFDRNGTETVIDASKYLKTDAEILIHFQGQQGLAHQATNDIGYYMKRIKNFGDQNKITVEQIEFENYYEVYSEGDVLLLPRRYGGNCLPLNEALSVGMPVLMTDISPNNQFLPKNWLLPVTKRGEFIPRTVIDIYNTDPEILAARIDEMFNYTEAEMGLENEIANKLADSISWETLKPAYEKVFAELCQTK